MEQWRTLKPFCRMGSIIIYITYQNISSQSSANNLATRWWHHQGAYLHWLKIWPSCSCPPPPCPLSSVHLVHHVHVLHLHVHHVQITTSNISMLYYNILKHLKPPGTACHHLVWPGTTLYHLAPPGTIIMSMSTISMSTRHPVSPGIAPTGITWHHLAGVYKWFWCLGTDIFAWKYALIATFPKTQQGA